MKTVRIDLEVLNRAAHQNDLTSDSLATCYSSGREDALNHLKRHKKSEKERMNGNKFLITFRRLEE